jgi:hypothetical protein
MLEKTLGVTLITKLRAILLMEGNFNATNKIVNGTRMLENACKHQLIPEEIFSKRNRMANDRTLCKMLFYDITRQARVPGAIASVDASTCNGFFGLSSIRGAYTSYRVNAWGH